MPPLLARVLDIYPVCLLSESLFTLRADPGTTMPLKKGFAYTATSWQMYGQCTDAVLLGLHVQIGCEEDGRGCLECYRTTSDTADQGHR